MQWWYHDHEDSIKQVSEDEQKIMLQICQRHPKFTRTCQVKISQTCQSVSSATRPVCILPGSKAFDSTAKNLLIRTTDKASASVCYIPQSTPLSCVLKFLVLQRLLQENAVGTKVATCNSRFLCRCDCYYHASSSFTPTVLGRRLPSRSSRMFLQWCTSLACVLCLFFFSRVFAAMTTISSRKPQPKRSALTQSKASIYRVQWWNAREREASS